MSDALTPEGSGSSPRQVVWVMVAMLIGIGIGAFVVQNTDRTPVDWLWWHVRAPLWLVLVVAMAAAVVLGELVAVGARRRRARRDR
jgi:uncharacterized integral membrane protein